MSSPIVVPFNFDPIATSIKTSNYTIPAGRYARISNLNNPAPSSNFSGSNTTGSAFPSCATIDGRVILVSGIRATLNANNFSAGSVTVSFSLIPSFAGIFTVAPSHPTGFCQVNSNSSWVTVVSGSSGTIFASGSFPNVTGLRLTWTGLQNTGSYAEILPYSSPSYFWAKEGEVIALTRSLVSVEEFNRIS